FPPVFSPLFPPTVAVAMEAPAWPSRAGRWIPKDLHQELVAHYLAHNGTSSDEEWNSWGQTQINAHETLSAMVNVHAGKGGPALARRIKEVLQPRLERWAGLELEETSLYGMREYTSPQYLRAHLDRPDVLVVSVTFSVFQEAFDHRKWPLEVNGFATNRFVRDGSTSFDDNDGNRAADGLRRRRAWLADEIAASTARWPGEALQLGHADLRAADGADAVAAAGGARGVARCRAGPAAPAAAAAEAGARADSATPARIARAARPSLAGPRCTEAKGIPRYETTTLMGITEGTPNRSLIIASTDLNDGMDIQSCDGLLQETDSTSIGPFGRSLEHLAGTSYREWLEDSDMAVITSFYACGPTYHGHKSARYIDHLAISSPWLVRVQKCAIACSLTRRVRAIPSVAVLDHMIIVAEIDFKLTYTAPRIDGHIWDFFTLSQAMRSEEEAQRFRDEVEQALEAKLNANGYTEAASWMRAHTLESSWL
ncbi:unnamed protein product, partial [Prorocentrum cordatum]